MPATEDYLRDPKRMHKIFAFSAVTFFAVTLWMMWADYADEWRTFQRTALKNVADRDKARIASLTKDPEFQKEEAEARAELQAVTDQLLAQRAELEQRQNRVAELSQKSAATMRELRVKRAVRDVARATYGLKVRDNERKAIQDEFRETYEAAEKDATEYENRFSTQSLEVAKAKAELAELTAEKEKAEQRLKALNADRTRLTAAVNKIEPSNPFSAFKRNVMLLPIINGFNSPERIQQDWMPRLEIDLGGLTKVQRFDRCRTCHLSIDSVDVGTNPAFPHGSGEKGSGTFEHPYASHPRLDLFLTSSSPHPLPKFGCTSCHSGQGSGTSFQNASHTPNHPGIMHEWEHDYKWFDNHFWEHPMHPKRFEESGCIKCHVNVVELGHSPKYGKTAPKVVRGYELVKTYGCFGCHEINGFEGTKIVGVDLRLEPNADDAEKIANDPTQVAGKMRKVGPSLRHIATKADRGWIENWTEEPKRFRPNTKMPQFFKLTNQHDELAAKFNPVELAGITTYLLGKSQPFELMTPTEGYLPNAERGKELFATKGCAVCHTHSDVQGINADFGPELSRMHAKLKAGKAGFDWIYSWIRDPQKYHPRTKMPYTFLEPQGEGENAVDPAADIAAFLLKLAGAPADFKPTAEYPTISVDGASLDDLVRNFLVKQLTPGQIDEFMQSGKYPIAAASIKGDEIELAMAPEGALDANEWQQRKLTYVGRKTISKYGCYGCHEIPNFEAARPIGTALQDWGKKDRSRLAFEHIHEYLHHHGQPELGMAFETLTPADAARLHVEGDQGVRIRASVPGVTPLAAVRVDTEKREKDALQVDDVILGFDGQAIVDAGQLSGLLRRSEPGTAVQLEVLRGGEFRTLQLAPDGSLEERVQEGLGMFRRGEFKEPAEENRETSAAFYYDSLGHHGRPGFLWQKLRQPRSYDYKMVETKPYDDRLRMPKFPFTEEDIDSIATFILGLTAEPPNPEYLYNPRGPAGDRIKGEALLQQFNCTGCHMIEMPEIRYGADLEGLQASDTSTEFPLALELLKKLKPPRNPLTGETKTVKVGDETKTLPVIAFHGLLAAVPNPEDDPEDQEYVVESWENLKVGEKEIFPTTKMIFPAAALQSIIPAYGGRYAEWLATRLLETKVVNQMALAWQASPPPLYQEGIKVQTPWLFNFLRNPEKIRHTTVLRMPRFNMSADEAQALANYFAAADGAVYPYQAVPQREGDYLSTKTEELHASFPEKDHDYLTETWKVLNSPLCVKCHAVGGRTPVSTDPAKDIRAPNLEMAGERLRPDWLLLWLYHPSWITPYTSMPQNFPAGKKTLEELFGGDGNRQTIGVRDALLNYHRLMERDGRIIYEPPMSATPPNAGADAAAPNEATTAVAQPATKVNEETGGTK
ncbi:MAG TPA: c-type cytochrome [Planctomycetaceae bacterium]|nr:c-type cytochrome [Planctomycetaceae bacterium]